MAQEPGERVEEFDLRLEWPRDRLIEPMEPAVRRPSEDPYEATAEDMAGPPEDVFDDEDEDGAAAEAPPVEEVEEEDPAEAHRRAFFRTLEPSVNDLVADYESLASTMSTFRNVVSGHLRGFLEEVGLLETVSAGYLKQYRDAHVRTLTELRHLVGDNPAWVQWLADSVREMSTAVDDAAQAVRQLGNDARQSMTRGDESVTHMTDTVRWLGEQLQSSLRELHNVVPGGDGKDTPLAGGESAVERAVSRLEQAVDTDTTRTPGDRDDIARTMMGNAGVEKELSRLAEEVRASRSLDAGMVEELLEKLQEAPTAGGDERGIRREIARLADELQALRRRLNLRAKAPAALEPDQIADIADAVAAALGGSTLGDTRRRPLEARRTTSTRKPRPRD